MTDQPENGKDGRSPQLQSGPTPKDPQVRGPTRSFEEGLDEVAFFVEQRLFEDALKLLEELRAEKGDHPAIQEKIQLIRSEMGEADPPPPPPPVYQPGGKTPDPTPLVDVLLGVELDRYMEEAPTHKRTIPDSVANPTADPPPPDDTEPPPPPQTPFAAFEPLVQAEGSPSADDFTDLKPPEDVSAHFDLFKTPKRKSRKKLYIAIGAGAGGLVFILILVFALKGLSKKKKDAPSKPTSDQTEPAKPDPRAPAPKASEPPRKPTRPAVKPLPGRKVRVQLTITPATAQPLVTFRGKDYPGAVFKTPPLPEGTKLETITITAPGYKKVKLEVIVNRNIVKTVALEPTGK